MGSHCGAAPQYSSCDCVAITCGTSTVNGTRCAADRSDASVAPTFVTTDGGTCFGVCSVCGAGKCSPPTSKSVPSTTTVSGLPLCCAYGRICGASGVTTPVPRIVFSACA